MRIERQEEERLEVKGRKKRFYDSIALLAELPQREGEKGEEKEEKEEDGPVSKAWRAQPLWGCPSPTSPLFPGQTGHHRTKTSVKALSQRRRFS